MPTYVLPDLDYDYSALEPHISGQIMQLHHDKHHAAYVTNANATMEKLQGAREKGDFSTIAALERALAFNLSGHVLHSIFWKNMKKGDGDKPVGSLAQTIDRDFGSFDTFQKQLIEATTTVMGSGWGALVWDPASERLITAQIYDHQGNTTQAGIPILVIDAWEHAFYLQYKNVKGDFFKAVWNVFNWDDAQARLDAAQKLKLPGTFAK